MLKRKQLYGLGLLIFLFSCGGKENGAKLLEDDKDSIIYFCGAEDSMVWADGEAVFQTDQVVFRNAETQCADFAFEGKYSAKLDSSHPYGMSFLLTDIEKGEFFQASVWQKETDGPGDLIFAISGETRFTLSANENDIYEHQNGWKKHVVQFSAVTALDSMTIFAFSGNDAVETYFDNLEVRRYKTRPKSTLKVNEGMSILLPDSSKEVLDEYIEKGARSEIIQSKYKKYVTGQLVSGQDTIPVEMRLKGDWTDHLLSGNVSYRIKTDAGSAFKGLRSFSIQHPKTRNNMHEWFMHQLADQEDLLSTHYSFIPVTINGNNKGVYALEEHFDKQLLESRNRREGPVLKIDESGFWALAFLAYTERREMTDYPYEVYEAAIISCFKENRTLKTDYLKESFKNGSILLEKFKKGSENPALLFDLNRVATYFALMDLGNVKHALAWHNRRFYYNPVTAKLEHIGFDMIPMVKPFNPLRATAVFEGDSAFMMPEQKLDRSFFLNADFRAAYTQKLIEFSDDSYLNRVFDELDSAIKHNEVLMRAEIPGYTFNRADYYEKAKQIRVELETLNSRWDAFMARADQKTVSSNGNAGHPSQSVKPYYLEAVSVNAFRSKLDSVYFKVEFENYHFDSVSIVGYSVKPDKKNMIPLDNPIDLGGFQAGFPVDTASLILNQKPSRFFFSLRNVPGIVKKKKFIKWEKPRTVHPRLTLLEGFKPVSNYYTVQNNVIRFRSGSYQMAELMYIPAGYFVQFDPGTTIDFISGGGLILNDNTRISGTTDAPVRFHSSDFSGRGITVLQADTVIIDYLEIENMNTLNYAGWKLTGALTVYEAYLKADHLTIRNNLCEDGLNAIRSHFDIKNCLIENTHSDGFDADFCTGSFANSTFKHTGNDCIDFSGSRVDIRDIIIEQSGDKGVSAGERSVLKLSHISVDGALTGLAAKDGSIIEGDNITVKNAEVGAAVFRKKPEYASSSMVLSNVKFASLNLWTLIEKGSSITVEGKTYYGYQKLDIERMYARFGEK